MGYKVLIPTAGTGSRLGGLTRYLNKSLVEIGGKPALSRIIDSFPSDCEFVIATGYKGELVKEFIFLAYPELNVRFVDVLLYEGEGSGLGHTVLTCKDYLQAPFVFCACDTIVLESIPEPTRNWIGYDHREALNRYRKIHIDSNGMVTEIDEKDAEYGELSEPYIGLAGIHDYNTFWESMEHGEEISISQGESYGLRTLIDKGLTAEKFTWFDIGVTVELEATRKRFENAYSPNILEKSNEAIWFLDNRVIKFSDDPRFISDRVKRSKLLKGFVPQVIKNTTHMYYYEYANGDVLSKCITRPLFEKLLKFSNEFWTQKELSADEKRDFIAACRSFYEKKTYDRVAQFYIDFEKKDNATIINEVEYPTLAKLLEKVDWDHVSEGLPGQFHGDYHFENIIYDKDGDTFKLIDWRQNFGDSLEVGDIYYDFAKLCHGMIISHELITKDLYQISWEGNTLTYDFARKQSLVECEIFFYKWLDDNGYDPKKVRIMTALIFLNICALHEYPYCLLLYGLGKKMLFEAIKGVPDNEI